MLVVLTNAPVEPSTPKMIATSNANLSAQPSAPITFTLPGKTQQKSYVPKKIRTCKHGYPGSEDLEHVAYVRPLKNGCFKCLSRNFLPKFRNKLKALERNSRFHYHTMMQERLEFEMDDDWSWPAPFFYDHLDRAFPGSYEIPDEQPGAFPWEYGMLRDPYSGRAYLSVPLTSMTMDKTRKIEEILQLETNDEFRRYLAYAATLGHDIADTLADNYIVGLLDKYRPEIVYRDVRDQIHKLKNDFFKKRHQIHQLKQQDDTIKEVLAAFGENMEETAIYNQGLFECSAKPIWKPKLQCASPDCPHERRRRNRRYCGIHHAMIANKQMGQPSGQMQGLTDSVADTFKKAFAKTTIKHEHDVPGIDRLIEEVTSLKTALGKALHNAHEAQEEERRVPWLKLLVSSLVLLSQIYRQWHDWPSVGLAITQFIMTLEIEGALKAQVMDLIKQLMSRIFKDEGPSGNAEDLADETQKEEIKIMSMFKILGPLLAVVAVVLIVYKIPAKESFSGFMRDYSKAGAIINSTETIWDRSSRMSEVLMNFIAGETQGYDGSSSWDSVKKWVKEVREIMNSKLHENMRHNDVLREKVDSLIISGNAIQQFLDSMKIPMNQRVHIQQCMMFLQQRALDIAEHSHGGITSPRIPPIIVHIFGDSGCGKTTTLNATIARYLTANGCTDPKDMETKVFYKNPSEDGRWDGYNTKVMMAICDDTRIIKDTIMRPNPELTDTLRMGNTATFLLQMPHLQDKGTTSFRATCVIWTTNRSSYKMESITNPEAILRRVTLKYRQKPHPSVEKTEMYNDEPVKMLDNVKVQEALQLGKNMRDMVLYDRVRIDESEQPKVIDENLTFDEMMNQVLAADHLNKVEFRNVIESNAEYWQECVERTKAKSDEFEKYSNINYKDTSEVEAVIEKFKVLHGKYRLWLLTQNEEEEPMLRDQNKRITRWSREMDAFESNLKRKYAKYDVASRLYDQLEHETVALPLENIGQPAPSVAAEIAKSLFDIIKPAGPAQGTSEEDNPYGSPSDYEFPMTTYFDSTWNPFRQPDPTHRHLNIRESLRFTDPVDVGEVRCGPSYSQFTDEGSVPLCAAQCVVIDEKKVDLFLRGFSAAKSNATAIGASFDDVFFTVSGLGPAHFSPCSCKTHTATEDDESFSNRMKRGWVKGFEQSRYNALVSAIDAAKHKNVVAWYVITGLQIGFNLLLLYLGYRFVKWAVVSAADALVSGVKKVGEKTYHSIRQLGYYIKGVFVPYDTPNKATENYTKIREILPAHHVTAACKLLALDETRLTPQQDELVVKAYRQYLTITTNENGKDEVDRVCSDMNIKSDEIREVFGQAQQYITGGPAGRPVGQVELSRDQNAFELGPYIYRNLYRLEYHDAIVGVWKHAMNLLVIKGRIGIVNKHLRSRTRYSRWRITNTQNPEGFEFNIWKQRRSFFEDSDEKYGHADVMLVELPRHVPQHQDITGKFMTSEDFSRFSTLNQVSLITYAATDLSPRQLFTSDIRADDRTFQLKSGVTQLGSIRRYFEYAMPTTGGYCGGVLCAYDKSFNRKLIGIHAAGQDHSKYTGVGQPIHQGLIRALLERLKIEAPDSEMSPDVEDIISEDISIVLEAEVGDEDILHLVCKDNTLTGTQPYGKLHMAPHRTYTSRIRKSPVYGVISVPKTKPALLRPIYVDGILVDPMRKAQMKATVNALPPDEVMTTAATNHYQQLVCAVINPDDTTVRSFEEAITGVEGNPFYSPINRKTSPGFGWKVGDGKREYLGRDEYKLDHPEVLRRHAIMWNLCKSGVRPSSVCIDTLKDERRPIAKVDQCKTRLFSAGEMVYTILFRQYFMGFIAHMMKNRIDFESCVGVNVFGSDWSRIANRITRYGDRVIAGDFTNYDGTLNAHFLWSVLDIVEAFYKGSEEDKLVRRCLWSDIVNSIHLSNTDLYGWTHSNPSGCAITTILNSVYHSIAARYVWMLCARQHAPMYYDLHQYDAHVTHVNYGDDDIYGVSAEVSLWFNQKTMGEAFLTIGMVYTDEQKTNTFLSYRSLSEIQFLKRQFRWDPNQMRYRAPLSLDTVKEMAQWVRGDVDNYEITANTLEDAVHELAQHSKEVFNRELPKFELARDIINKKIPVFFHTYDHYQEIEMLRWVDPMYYRLARFDIPNPELVTLRKKTIELGKRMDVDRCDIDLADIQFDDPFDRMLTPAGEAQVGDFVAHSNDKMSGKASGDANTITHSEQAKDSERKTVDVGMAGGSGENDETKEVVLFREDAPVALDNPGPSNEVLDYIELTDDALKHDIVGFLSRPFIAKRFLWRSTMVGTDELFSLQFPTVFFTNPMMVGKLKGFRYLRCDFEVRIQCNAQPFNAGLLLMFIDPIRETCDTVPSYSGHLGGYTGLRHVCLDLSEATAAEIHVPYVLPAPYFVLDSGNDLCRVTCVVYSALTGTGDVDGTVWVNATNVRVEMPIWSSVSPKTDDSIPADKQQPSGEAQVGDRNIRQKEEAVAGGGSVEKIARTTSRVAGLLTSVPEIGSVAQVVSWAANAAAGVAAYFGWSKPSDINTLQSVQLSYMKHYCNFNGDTKDKALGLDAQNAIRVLPGMYGTELDEMSLTYIISRPVFLGTLRMTTSDTPGTMLRRIPVHPAYCIMGEKTGINLQQHYNTYLSYLSNMFRFWRGSIVYHFRIVKTAFHSGRIRVVYNQGTGTHPTSDAQYCYQQIIDIRERTSFVIEVPYAVPMLWSSTFSPDENIGLPYLFIEVLNPLRCPTTVSDAINFVIEVSGGDDFQFAVPYVEQDRRVYLDTYLPPTLFEQTPSGTAQVADDQQDEITPMFVNRGMTGITPNTMGVGEVVTSLRQLLKRYELFTGTVTLDAPGYAITYNPYLAADTTASANNPSQTMFLWVSVLYRFYAGSMKVMVESRDNVDPSTRVRMSVSSSSYNVHTTDTLRGQTRPWQYFTPYYEPFMEVRLPWYTKMPLGLTAVGKPFLFDTPFVVSNKTSSASPMTVHVEANKKLVCRFHRMIGEDFNMGYLLGPPVTIGPRWSYP